LTIQTLNKNTYSLRHTGSGPKFYNGSTLLLWSNQAPAERGSKQQLSWWELRGRGPNDSNYTVICPLAAPRVQSASAGNEWLYNFRSTIRLSLPWL